MKQQPFASPGEALEHYGTKGMRWGVRKEDTSGPKSKSNTAKKIAVGAGAVTLAAGAGFVAWKLNQSGNVKVSSIKRTTDDLSRAKSQLDQMGLDDEAKRFAEQFLNDALK